MSDVTVLVVEDSPDLSAMLEILLKTQGYNVVTASTGYEAVRLARRVRPQLILSDLGLPGMDGWEVLSQIRADPALEDVPAIAITAYSLNTLGPLVRQAGFARVMAKPLDVVALLREIAILVNSTPAKSPRFAFA